MGHGPLRLLAVSALVAGWSAACAPIAPLPSATPELPLADWERTGPAPRVERLATSSEYREQALAKSAANPDSKPEGRRAAPTPRTAPSAVVGGAACLTELATRGVRFSRSEPVLGVATPIVVEGNLLGVRFYTHEKKPFVIDCRLALALAEIAPDLRALGITEARYSGAYVYRTSHPGRMSLHAYGLAIDLHEFKAGGEAWLVKKQYERGRGCASGLPLLNDLSCRVRARRLFHEQIGPDDNAAHHDHFHFGLRPLPEEVAADLPLPAPPPRRRATRPARAHAGSIPEVAPNGTRNVAAKARNAAVPPAR